MSVSFPEIIDTEKLGVDIRVLSDALDPGKVLENSNLALDMLLARGLDRSDILQRQIAFSLVQNVRAVLGGDIYMSPQDRYFYTNQRDGTPLDVADNFANTCVTLLDCNLIKNQDRRDAERSTINYLESIIFQSLVPAVRPLPYGQSRILYPAAHLAFTLRAPISLELFGLTRNRIQTVLSEVTRMYYDARRLENPSPVDEKSLLDETNFSVKWIAENFSPLAEKDRQPIV